LLENEASDIKHVFNLHHNDTRDLLKVIPSSKPLVDVTITSPPYYDLKNYEFEGQIGHGQSYNEYLNDLEKIFRDVYQITKETGSLWIILDTFKRQGNLVPLPFDLANRLKTSGWRLKDIIIWEKDRTLPWSRKGELRSIFEYILFFVKGKNFKYYVDRIKISDPSKFAEWWVKYPERYNPRGKVPTRVWEFAIPTQGSWGHRFLRHFCPFPTELVERIVLLTTNKGDTVLDPFTGSGVVLAVANSMQRRYIGFELKKNYVEMFPAILKETKAELEIRKRHRDAQKSQQEKLETTIKRLRLVKYPKALVRRLYIQKLIEPQKFPINTIFAISREFSQEELERKDRFKFLKEDLYLVFNFGSHLGRAKLYEHIESVASRPPLSKFGIASNFHLLTRDRFIKEQKLNPYFDWNKLWFYVRGVMNMNEKSITFDEWQQESSNPEWKQYFKNGVPPVVSNIEVNQPLIKTWKPKIPRSIKAQAKAKSLAEFTKNE